MNRITAWLISGVSALALVAAPTASLAKKKGTFEATRAGWMLGMYVGEEKGYPYPFVLQLDEQSDAKQKGIRTGDELIRFEEEEIRDLPSLFEKATKLRAGREVPLWVRRGSQTLQFRVRVPRNPGAPPATDKDKASEKKSEKPDEKADASADGDKKSKKSKKKGPVVIKPIPTDN